MNKPGNPELALWRKPYFFHLSKKPKYKLGFLSSYRKPYQKLRFSGFSLRLFSEANHNKKLSFYYTGDRSKSRQNLAVSSDLAWKATVNSSSLSIGRYNKKLSFHCKSELEAALAGGVA